MSPALSVAVIASCGPSARHLRHSLYWKQALFKALKLVSLFSNQTTFQHSNKPLLLSVWTVFLFFVFLKALKSDSELVENWHCWKLNVKFICESFSTLHVFSFFQVLTWVLTLSLLHEYKIRQGNFTQSYCILKIQNIRNVIKKADTRFYTMLIAA